MDDDVQARIALLEQHIDWLYANAGLQGPYGTQYAAPQAAPAGAAQAQDWPYPVSQRVLETIKRGQVIQAVKEQREETGVGLAEAKHAVDAARAMLR